MGVKPDAWIRQQAEKHRLICPFEPRLVTERVVGSQPLPEPDEDVPITKRVISYGLSSYGYDVRLADDFRLFRRERGRTIIDPKAFDEDMLETHRSSTLIMPANSYVLARTVEYLRLPRDVLALCLGKSSYARAGIIVNTTPLEPEWEGTITLEISNSASAPCRLYAGEGIAQVIFLSADCHAEFRQLCHVSYADRNGKYQRQIDVTPPRL